MAQVGSNVHRVVEFVIQPIEKNNGTIWRRIVLTLDSGEFFELVFFPRDEDIERLKVKELPPDLVRVGSEEKPEGK